MLLLLVSNMIILPVTITFFREDLSPVMVLFNVVSDICFMADICLNFRTGYMAPGAGVHIILKPKLIAKRFVLFNNKCARLHPHLLCCVFLFIFNEMLQYIHHLPRFITS